MVFKYAKEYENNEEIGIIILTARVQEKDQVHGLTIGADDYIKTI